MAKQYFIPGFGVVDIRATKQYLIPEFGMGDLIGGNYTQTPKGGIVFGGSVLTDNSFDFVSQTPTGGIVFGGSSPITIFYLNQSWFSPSGGIVFGGSSPIILAPSSHIFIPSGGIVFGGSAPFCGYTDQGKLLVEITLNGEVNRVSTEGHALTHNWRPRIINIGGPTYSIPSDHGGFAKMVFGNVTFNPELFRDYWPPPISCHIEFYYTDTTEEARELIFKGTAHIYSYDRVGITYAIYGPIYDDLVPDSTVYSGDLNATITSILTLIPEITNVNISLARNPSPTVNYTSTGDNVLAINLASEIAEFFTHLFYIIGTTAYLVNMGADNGTKDLTNEFKFLAYPKYKHKSPIAVLSADTYSQSSDYPYGSESSVTAYTDNQTDIETALANIIEIENAPRINFDAPMIHRNFLLHGQRVSLFDSANVVDLYSWMRVRKIQYDFNQWKINFEGEGAILNGDEFNGEPFCLKLVAETPLLSSSPQATPTHKIIYKDGKIYALASDGATGNAHGYIIEANTMNVLSTIDYGISIDSFQAEGSISWADDIGRFITMGIRGGKSYLYELDENLAITRKAFVGTVKVFSGLNYGTIMDFHYRVEPGFWTLIDQDADVGIAIDNPTCTGGGLNAVYLDGYYIVGRRSGGYFANAYVFDRDTLLRQGYFDATSWDNIVYDGKVYCVNWPGSNLYEIDPNIAGASTTRTLTLGGGYMARPYAYDGFIYVSNSPGSLLTNRTIYKIDISTFTVVASYVKPPGDSYSPDEAVMGADGRLYVTCTDCYLVLDPSDMTLICKYPLHGSTGLDTDGIRYIYGAEANSGKIQKYLPGGTTGFGI